SGDQPARGAAGPAEPDLHVHLARPVGGGAHLRPGRRDVRRQGGRGRQHPGPVPPAAAPVHGGAAVGAAAAGPAEPDRDRPAQGRGAEPGEPAVGLLLPHPVPVRAGDLLGRGPAAAGDPERGRHRQARGRVPRRRGIGTQGRPGALGRGGRRKGRDGMSAAQAKVRTGRPQFVGITTYTDPEGRFEFRYPSGWILSELDDDLDGRIVRPEADEDATYFAVWAIYLDVAVVADDLEPLREGFDDGLARLTDLEVEKAEDNTYNDIIK